MQLYVYALEKGRKNVAKVQSERDTLREKFLQFGAAYGPGEWSVDCVGRLVREGSPILTVLKDEPKVVGGGVSVYPLVVRHDHSQVSVQVRCVEDVELKLAELLEHPDVMARIIEDEKRLLMK